MLVVMVEEIMVVKEEAVVCFRDISSLIAQAGLELTSPYTVYAGLKLLVPRFWA